MKRLQLTDEQERLVFHGLGQQLAHEEAIAAIDFSMDLPWSQESMRASLDSMRECHALRAKIWPHVFRAKAVRS